jgi:hypothetical protein
MSPNLIDSDQKQQEILVKTLNFWPTVKVKTHFFYLLSATVHGWFLGEVYKNSFATETKGGVF